MMQNIRSLLFVCDETPISRIEGKETAQLIPSQMCVLKSAMQYQSKRSEQILLAQMQRPDLVGQLPFT